MADFSQFEPEFDATRSFMHYDSVRVPAPTAKRYSEQTTHGSGLIGPSLLFKYGSGRPALSISANSPIRRSACNPLAHGMGHGTRRAQQFDERSNSLAPRDFFRRVSPGCGGAVGPVSSQPPPQEVNVSLIPRSASLLLGRPQPFTVVVRCCLKHVFAATQSAPSTKKNPALIGPGSPFEMDSTEAYWAVVLTHETRKGTIGCGTAVLVVVVVTLAVGKNGGANPFA